MIQFANSSHEVFQLGISTAVALPSYVVPEGRPTVAQEFTPGFQRPNNPL
jgi:hypothetical protein